MSKIITGIKWMAIGQFSSYFMKIVANFVLAALLLPEAFGMAMVVLAVIHTMTLLAEMGFGQAVIQKSDLTQKHLTTIFYTNLIVSVFIFLFIFVFANLIANFYGEPSIQELIQIGSTVIIIKMFSAVQIAHNEKKFNFKLIVKIQIFAVLIGAGLKIVLAYNNYEVWSLIYGEIVTQLIILMLIWFNSSWWPKLKDIEYKALKSVIGFGGKLTVINFINVFSSKLDILTIASVVSVHEVGLYTFSLLIISLIPGQINAVVQKVMFPAFALHKDKHENLKTIFLETTRYISLIALPMVVGIGFISNELITIFFTEKWSDAIPLIEILVIYAISNSMGGVLWQQILKAKAKFRMLLYLSVSRSIFLIISIMIGSQWGGQGVAYALGIYGIIFRIFNQYFVNKIILIEMKEYLMSILPAMFITLIMGSTLFLVDYFVSSNTGITLVISMTSKIFVGISSYMAALYVFYRNDYRTILKILTNRQRTSLPNL